MSKRPFDYKKSRRLETQPAVVKRKSQSVAARKSSSDSPWRMILKYGGLLIIGLLLLYILYPRSESFDKEFYSVLLVNIDNSNSIHSFTLLTYNFEQDCLIVSVLPNNLVFPQSEDNIENQRGEKLFDMYTQSPSFENKFMNNPVFSEIGLENFAVISNTVFKDVLKYNPDVKFYMTPPFDTEFQDDFIKEEGESIYRPKVESTYAIFEYIQRYSNLNMPNNTDNQTAAITWLYYNLLMTRHSFLNVFESLPGYYESSSYHNFDDNPENYDILWLIEDRLRQQNILFYSFDFMITEDSVFLTEDEIERWREFIKEPVKAMDDFDPQFTISLMDKSGIQISDLGNIIDYFLQYGGEITDKITNESLDSLVENSCIIYTGGNFNIPLYLSRKTNIRHIYLGTPDIHNSDIIVIMGKDFRIVSVEDN